MLTDSVGHAFPLADLDKEHYRRNGANLNITGDSKPQRNYICTIAHYNVFAVKEAMLIFCVSA